MDQNKFVFQLPDAGSINHITVFLLPETPFPDGFGATVFFSWPGRPFQLLGGLANNKASAIFKLGGVQRGAGDGQGPVTASLGISIEPLQDVEAQVMSIPKNTGASTSGTVAAAPPSAEALTTRIVTNL